MLVEPYRRWGYICYQYSLLPNTQLAEDFVNKSVTIVLLQLLVALLYIAGNSSTQFLAEETLEGLAVLCKLLDTLVQLVECHRVLEEGPAELGLVVDERDLGHGLGLCS